MEKSLFNKRDYYKPFWFPWAYEAFVKSEQMHWLAREVPLNNDVYDWKMHLTESEKNLLTQIFRFFTQADIDVASGYIDKFLPLFKPIELRMMMSSISAREGVHIQAYSMLIDEIGIPETAYSVFMNYKEMKDKHEFLFEERSSDNEISKIAEDIAVFSAFGEGLQLFASFVILLNFTRFGKMKGMGQIISWSIRDETHHVDSMVQLYNQLLADNSKRINKRKLEEEVTKICYKMVELEDRFIDLSFEQGDLEQLTASDVKQYIRYIADVRMKQLGFTSIYGLDKNPLPWVDIIVFGKEHTNFFENRATDYSKGTVIGSWDEAFA